MLANTSYLEGAVTSVTHTLRGFNLLCLFPGHFPLEPPLQSQAGGPDPQIADQICKWE